jgi:hypothetical protein
MHRSPPAKAQKRDEIMRLCGALTAICSAWDDAVEAARARGYQVRSGEVVGGPRKRTFGDPTARKALQDDPAARWLSGARRALGVLLRFSPDRRAWSGPFHPPALRGALLAAAEEVVWMWPKNVEVLIEWIHNLANTARVEWPPTPKPGDTIDGVTVGRKANPVETCTECGGVIGANAADPLARIDGKPYHRNPCYHTVYMRAKRRSGVNSASPC